MSQTNPQQRRKTSLTKTKMRQDNSSTVKTYSQENLIEVSGENHKILPFEIKTKVEFAATSCRICLNDGDIPIFGEETFGGLSVIISKLTDVKIEEDDEFPKYLCHSCNEQLQSALLFIQIAKETDKSLREAGYINTCKISESEESETDAIPKTYYRECDFKQTLQDEHTTFHCSKCDLDFSNSKIYAKHMLTKAHKNVSDTCPFCCRRFKCIVRHLFLHKKSKTHQCHICGQKFMNPSYTNHLESHFDNLPYKCPDCPYRGRFMGDLKVHMRTHSGDMPYECPECSRRFTTKSNLNRHRYTHRVENHLKCDVCDKSFLTQLNLNMHKKRLHSSMGEMYNCENCSKSFPSRLTLTRHTLQVHKRDKLRTGRIPNYLNISDNMATKDADEEYLFINLQ